MYYCVGVVDMITANLTALRASIRTLLLIGGLATVGAGVMTLGIGMDLSLIHI